MGARHPAEKKFRLMSKKEHKRGFATGKMDLGNDLDDLGNDDDGLGNDLVGRLHDLALDDDDGHQLSLHTPQKRQHSSAARTPEESPLPFPRRARARAMAPESPRPMSAPVLSPQRRQLSYRRASPSVAAPSVRSSFPSMAVPARCCFHCAQQQLDKESRRWLLASKLARGRITQREFDSVLAADRRAAALDGEVGQRAASPVNAALMKEAGHIAAEMDAIFGSSDGSEVGCSCACASKSPSPVSVTWAQPARLTLAVDPCPGILRTPALTTCIIENYRQRID